MKHPFLRASLRLALLLAGCFILPAARADQTKANNNSNLELGSSWVGNVAPGGGDNAIWNSTVAMPANCTNTLGSAVVWGGIVISNPSAPVVINGPSTTLTLTNGVGVSATQTADTYSGKITYQVVPSY